MINFQLNKKRAFTLIEVLVAASVLAVGLVAAAGMFSFALKYSSGAKMRAAASGILQEKMESAIALGYEEAVSEDKVRFSGSPESPFFAFKTQVSVSFVDENLGETQIDTGLKKIKVSVFWDDSGAEKEEDAFVLISE